MTQTRKKPRRRSPASMELLLLPDGRLLAHNLTPVIARALRAAGVRPVQAPAEAAPDVTARACEPDKIADAEHLADL